MISVDGSGSSPSESEGASVGVGVGIGKAAAVERMRVRDVRERMWRRTRRIFAGCAVRCGVGGEGLVRVRFFNSSFLFSFFFFCGKKVQILTSCAESAITL